MAHRAHWALAIAQGETESRCTIRARQGDTVAQQPSHLIAIVFDDEYKADEARVALRRMQGEGLIDIDESATVVCRIDTKVRLSQDVDLVANRKNIGHWIGIAAAMATGVQPMILLGTATGAIIGRLTDHGITDRVLKQIGQSLVPGTSALLLLVRQTFHRDQVIERLRPYNGTIVQTTLPAEAEAALQSALEAQGS
jgi:uncharacterized membrane protein